jgi:hypothetical protein
MDHPVPETDAALIARFLAAGRDGDLRDVDGIGRALGVALHPVSVTPHRLDYRAEGTGAVAAVRLALADPESRSGFAALSLDFADPAPTVDDLQALTGVQPDPSLLIDIDISIDPAGRAPPRTFTSYRHGDRVLTLHAMASVDGGPERAVGLTVSLPQPPRAPPAAAEDDPFGL